MEHRLQNTDLNYLISVTEAFPQPLLSSDEGYAMEISNGLVGILEIKSVGDEHAGLYYCQPFNSVGSNGRSRAIEVTVIDPPVFNLKPRKEYWVNRFESIEIPCEAMGDPWPRTTLVTEVSLLHISISLLWFLSYSLKKGFVVKFMAI